MRPSSVASARNMDIVNSAYVALLRMYREQDGRIAWFWL